MGTRYLQLAGAMTAPTYAGSRLLLDAVGAAGGYVLDTQRFSNKALRLTLGATPARLAPLAEALRLSGLAFSPGSEKELARFDPAGGEKDEVTVFLGITFVNDEPDQRIFAPAIPG